MNRLKRILYLGLDPAYYSHDGELIHCPIIQIIPRGLSDPDISFSLSSFDRYTHLIFSSKTSIPILLDYLPKKGFSLEQWVDKTVLSVGRSTTLSLERYGIKNIFTAEQETAEGIVDLIKNLIPINAYMFWPHSSGARSLIKDYLSSVQISYKECNLYDTASRIPSPLPELSEFNEVVFTSPSTVDAFFDIFGRAIPSHLQLTSIGPITASHLKEAL